MAIQYVFNVFTGTFDAVNTAAASPLMNLRYTNSNAQSITNATEEVVTNWTVDRDAGGDFDPVTGIFTPPVTGVYQIACALMVTNSAWNTGGRYEIRVQVSGTPNVRTLVFWSTPATIITTFYNMQEGVDTIALTAGVDTLAISVFVSDANGHALDANPLYSWLNISQIQ